MQEIRTLIESSPKITILTGAGVSADSGIPDFKTTDETWKYPLSRQEVISRHFFNRNPRMFWKLYRNTFGDKINATPNRFHYYLASLQANHDITIVTQNVDGLHLQAGSKNVIESHGNMHQGICARLSCSTLYQYEDLDTINVPKCSKCGKVIKPNISLFGEGITGFGDARDIIVESDLLIVAGTSLMVGPINELPLLAEHFAPTVQRLWMNQNPPPEDYNFTHTYIGSFQHFIDNIATSVHY